MEEMLVRIFEISPLENYKLQEDGKQTVLNQTWWQQHNLPATAIWFTEYCLGFEVHAGHEESLLVPGVNSLYTLWAFVYSDEN